MSRARRARAEDDRGAVRGVKGGNLMTSSLTLEGPDPDARHGLSRRGHFVAEEASQETLAALITFLIPSGWTGRGAQPQATDSSAAVRRRQPIQEVETYVQRNRNPALPGRHA